jgi:CRISPR-associated endonuclease/helicase Cas3
MRKGENQVNRYLAHSENNVKQTHTVHDHLASVAEKAKIFASIAPWNSEAAFAGLLHDLGKYADLFQARLRGEVSGLDHWSAGAWVALEYRSVAAALAIQGHHIGLQKGSNEALRSINPTFLSQHPLKLRLTDSDLGRLKSRAAEDGLTFVKPQKTAIQPGTGFQNPVANMLDVRMLFSCLADADFIDTEAHFKSDENGKCRRRQGPPLETTQALEALTAFMAGKVRPVCRADQVVVDARNALWNMVTQSATAMPGLFTLTAPTGSGKTLAMLKFALEHAAQHDLKRVILVVPFLSIIEQTAAIYQAVFEAFPDNYVLEHHSLAGMGAEEAKDDAEQSVERTRRLLSENWDAPIIITTNVQLLESLFSNRPSACRKLHNLMESVIMFDEAQTLPQALAIPTLAALSHLSQAYRTTVLFATATQPAFDTLGDTVKKLVLTGWRPMEAAPEHARLYDVLRRYDVQWPKQDERPDWPTLSGEIRNEFQVLCVVNLKSHAAAILEALKYDDNTFHLSTNLCALHRRAVLETVRTRLKSGQPCRLISTQCIEAGVDVDFPVVYRALAPLDAIAQAAGRCNREGRLTDEAGQRKMGAVRVFEPAVEGTWKRRYPTHAYFQAAEVMRTMLIESGETGLDLNDSALFREYYRRLYGVSRPDEQSKSIQQAFDEKDFVRVAQEYRLIDQAAIQVLVPYHACLDIYEGLKREQDEWGINAKWIQKAQGLSVSIFRPNQDHPAWGGVLNAVRLGYGKGLSNEWFVLHDPQGKFYDEVFGLRLPKEEQILIG